MGVEVVDHLSVGDLMLAKAVRCAGFERTLDRVSDKIVCCRPPARDEQRFGIRYTDVRQKLEVVSIHARKEPEEPCRHVSIHPKR